MRHLMFTGIFFIDIFHFMFTIFYLLFPIYFSIFNVQCSIFSNRIEIITELTKSPRRVFEVEQPFFSFLVFFSFFFLPTHYSTK